MSRAPVDPHFLAASDLALEQATLLERGALRRAAEHLRGASEALQRTDLAAARGLADAATGVAVDAADPEGVNRCLRVSRSLSAIEERRAATLRTDLGVKP